MKMKAAGMASSKQTKLSAFFAVAPLRQQSNNCDDNMSRKRKSETVKSQNENSPKKSKKGENSPVKKSPKKGAAKLPTVGQTLKGSVEASWSPALEKEYKKTYYQNLNRFVEQERKKATIFPKQEDVFAWTKACKLKDVKVVILGQDPYHGPNQAHGLCFSVLPGVQAPPSLQNIYKELTTDISGFETPGHGYLMGWAKQGVLLLNAVLTVRSGAANSHKDKGWEQLTDAVMQHLNTNMSNLVFMLWGSYAQKKGARINKKKHCVLNAVHPSPLSAHRGFFGCKHFSRANAYLESHGKPTVDWNDLPNKH